METILNIEEVENIEPQGFVQNFGGYSGFKITTNKHNYYFLIDSYQNCCENWGYISCEDYKNMIGKELESIEVVTTANEKMKIELEQRYLNDEDIYEGGVVFINVNGPDLDQIQFAVYNNHNGYYGHEVKFVVDDEVEYDNYL